MAAEESICRKRRHGFRKGVAALCKIGELEGARENTNERRQLHHLDTRRYFDYTSTCLAIQFSNYVPSNERATLSVRAAAVFMYSSEHLDGQILEFFKLSKIDKRSTFYCVTHVFTKELLRLRMYTSYTSSSASFSPFFHSHQEVGS